MTTPESNRREAAPHEAARPHRRDEQSLPGVYRLDAVRSLLKARTGRELLVPDGKRPNKRVAP